MFLITTLFGAISLLYIWLKWNYSFWKWHKVAGPEPANPFFVRDFDEWRESRKQFCQHFPKSK